MQRFLSICKLCKPTFYSNEKIYKLGIWGTYLIHLIRVYIHACERVYGKRRSADAEKLCDEVRKQAKLRGYRNSDLKKARKELQVKAFHQFDGDGATDNWFWYLEE